MPPLRLLVLPAFFVLVSSFAQSFEPEHQWPSSEVRFNSSMPKSDTDISAPDETDYYRSQFKTHLTDHFRINERPRVSRQKPTSTRKRTRATQRPQLSSEYQFLPTPLPLVAFAANVSKSSDEAASGSETAKPVTTAADSDSDYASGPIALQHFLKFRNESMPPFRLESLTTDHFKTQNSSVDSSSSSEDHVKDILDRFKTNNSDFLPVSSDEKEPDFKEHGQEKGAIGARDQQLGVNEDEPGSKHGQMDGNVLFQNFPTQTSYPFNQFQAHHSLRSGPRQDKTNLKSERNHSPKENEFQKSGLSFPKHKRAKEKVQSKVRDKNEGMAGDPKDEVGSRFSEESGSGKSPHHNIEVLQGFGRKAFKPKTRSPVQPRPPPPQALTTESMDDAFTSLPSPSRSQDSGPMKHESMEEEPGSKENEIGIGGESHKENEGANMGSLHRQASSGRNYPPAFGYDMPYHSPPPMPHPYPQPPYPYPIPPLMYPPPPPPPVTCCKTYYPGAGGIPPYHKHELYPHASNEVDGVSIAAAGSAKSSESATAETTMHPMLGYDVPGESFCYQEPMLPHPLIWKQMKLQKLLYPFLLKKRLFFG